jgi:hypothetical protein
MQKWDLFVRTRKLEHETDDDLVTFKAPDSKSYFRFREMMHMIDATILDIQTIRYRQLPLAASFLYLLAGRDQGHFTFTEVESDFSTLFSGSNTRFAELFTSFLAIYCGITLTELLPTLKYAVTYVSIPLIEWDLPSCINKIQPEMDGTKKKKKKKEVTALPSPNALHVAYS